MPVGADPFDRLLRVEADRGRRSAVDVRVVVAVAVEAERPDPVAVDRRLRDAAAVEVDRRDDALDAGLDRAGGSPTSPRCRTEARSSSRPAVSGSSREQRLDARRAPRPAPTARRPRRSSPTRPGRARPSRVSTLRLAEQSACPTARTARTAAATARQPSSQTCGSSPASVRIRSPNRPDPWHRLVAPVPRRARSGRRDAGRGGPRTGRGSRRTSGTPARRRRASTDPSGSGIASAVPSTISTPGAPPSRARRASCACPGRARGRRSAPPVGTRRGVSLPVPAPELEHGPSRPEAEPLDDRGHGVRPGSRAGRGRRGRRSRRIRAPRRGGRCRSCGRS